MKNRVCVGKVASAHGVKGLVKIIPYCDDLSLLEGKLYTGESGNETLELNLKNPMGKYFLAQIKGIDSREAADALKCSLFVSRETLPETDENEFYITDLVGLNARTPDGEALGLIKAVDNFGAGDLLEILPAGGAAYYIPFHDDFVGHIDLDAKTIIITGHEDFMIS